MSKETKSFEGIYGTNEEATVPVKKANIPQLQVPAEKKPIEKQKPVTGEELEKIKALQLKKEYNDALLKMANTKVGWSVRTKKLVQIHFNRICYNDNLTQGELMAKFIKVYYDTFHNGEWYGRPEKPKDEENFDIDDLESLFD